MTGLSQCSGDDVAQAMRRYARMQRDVVFQDNHPLIVPHRRVPGKIEQHLHVRHCATIRERVWQVAAVMPWGGCVEALPPREPFDPAVKEVPQGSLHELPPVLRGRYIHDVDAR